MDLTLRARAASGLASLPPGGPENPTLGCEAPGPDPALALAVNTRVEGAGGAPADVRAPGAGAHGSLGAAAFGGKGMDVGGSPPLSLACSTTQSGS
jgi:hypothetical protein